MAPLPRQSLLRVVGRPDVEGRQRVDRAAVGDREVSGDLRPGANADAIGLGDRQIGAERVRRRLAVTPDAFLERALELGLVGSPHQLRALVVEGGEEEEAVVFELEVLLGLPDTTLT